MKLKSLEITGFRGIAHLELEFPERVNVLVGVNGAGKSAVLDCTAIMLSLLIERIRSPTGRGRSFVDHDITNGIAETRNEIELRFQGDSVRWSVTKARRGRRQRTLTRLVELRRSVESYGCGSGTERF